MPPAWQQRAAARAAAESPQNARSVSVALVAPRGAGVELTFQQLAQLAAELEVFPERQGTTWSKFDVSSPARHAALVDVWQANFRREPRLYDEWRALKASYVEWFSRR